MSPGTRKSELVLILAFLGIIFAVPAAQTCVELARGGGVRATDLFRTLPTSANLRQYERNLEESSVFRQQARPLAQCLLTKVFGDLGANAVAGRDGWLFYRPDIRHVVEGANRAADRAAVADAIARYRDQLATRDIRLLVVPVPGKPSVYPDKLTARTSQIDSPTLDLLAELRSRKVETVDLFRAFREARSASSQPLYLAKDTHWTPRGAQLAAAIVARRLNELGWIQHGDRGFSTRAQKVMRRGDILEMTRTYDAPDACLSDYETVDCVQVIDAAKGLLVPAAADRPGTFKYPAQQSMILVLGDSFCRIYQFPEPRSLGRTGDASASDAQRRLLPGSAGFVSHLALSLGSPVDAIVSDGGASTEVRRRLATNPEILEAKKVVVWEFVERDISLGPAGWSDVPLPAPVAE